MIYICEYFTCERFRDMRNHVIPVVGHSEDPTVISCYLNETVHLLNVPDLTVAII